MKTTLVINDETLALAISNIKDFAKKNEPFNVIIKPVADKKEMADFITKIIAYCTEWGIDIPICNSDYNF